MISVTECVMVALCTGGILFWAGYIEGKKAMLKKSRK